jgi:hypothetical protein
LRLPPLRVNWLKRSLSGAIWNSQKRRQPMAWFIIHRTLTYFRRLASRASVLYFILDPWPSPTGNRDLQFPISHFQPTAHRRAVHPALRTPPHSAPRTQKIRVHLYYNHANLCFPGKELARRSGTASPRALAIFHRLSSIFCGCGWGPRWVHPWLKCFFPLILILDFPLLVFLRPLAFRI